MEDSWYGVYFQDNYIGYSHYYMKIQDKSEGGGYLLRTDAKLNLPVLGQINKFELDTKIKLFNNYKLREALFKVRSANYFFKGTITKGKGNEYKLETVTPTQKVSKDVVLEEDELVSSLLGPLSLNYIPIRKQVNFSFYDPFVNRRSKVSLYNQGKTTLMVGDDQLDVYKIDMDVEGVPGGLLPVRRNHAHCDDPAGRH